MTFTSIPILKYTDSLHPTTKPSFLLSLQHALINVGFFYLTDCPISPSQQENLLSKCKALFALPEQKKLEIEMVNSPHFLGYSRLGAEITARRMDWREQFDFATELPAPGPEEPLYKNIRGPNQWPDEKYIPGFRHTLETYLAALAPIAEHFQALIAEALGLEASALKDLFDEPVQQKLKLIKYPAPTSSSDEGSSQGVGPHKDSEFLTFLYQATPHKGLEVQNKQGQWIAADPIPGSLVVNIGRALEAITQGVCVATTHRVNLSSENYTSDNGTSLGPRFSIPVFQGMSLDLVIGEIELGIPAHIRALAGENETRSDAEKTFNSAFSARTGEGTFLHRIISHRDVGERWYPDVLRRALEEYN
ncbi:putative oxidoreductase [Aspergillus unguis]